MDIKAIEELVKMIENSNFNEFSYEEGETKIYMSKLDNPPIVAPADSAVPAAAPCAVPASVPAAEEKPEEDETTFIYSPIVGTFYSAAAPDVPAFVKVGDQVKAGQTVCILEAMKLMNEIQADFNCEIEAVLASNEQKVEYGQPLFKIKKI